MKVNAIICAEIAEDIGSVELQEIELIEPGPGQVRVRLKACAVNFPDLLMIQGKYQFKPPLPFRQVAKLLAISKHAVPELALKKATR